MAQLKKTVRNVVQRKGLNDKVIFLGVRNDVAELMNAADIFILPSKNEGFPITFNRSPVYWLDYICF